MLCVGSFAFFDVAACGLLRARAVDSLARNRAGAKRVARATATPSNCCSKQIRRSVASPGDVHILDHGSLARPVALSVASARPRHADRVIATPSDAVGEGPPEAAAAQTCTAPGMHTLILKLGQGSAALRRSPERERPTNRSDKPLVGHSPMRACGRRWKRRSAGRPFGRPALGRTFASY